MKTSKAMVVLMAALAIATVQVEAQRGGGSRPSGGGGSSRPSAGSVSRPSGAHSGGSVSRPSHSSSVSRPSSSVSRPSSSVSRPSSSASRPSGSVSRPSGSSNISRPTSSSRPTASAESTRPSGSVRAKSSHEASRPSSAVRPQGSGSTARPTGTTRPRGTAHATEARGSRQTGSAVRPSAGATRTSGSVLGGHDRGYARPARPGGALPPSSRPIHPAPYFHHPYHGYMVHCHPIFWDPLPPRPWYWPGFWLYCNSYWYDYHVTDVVVVHDYVQKTYSVDLITYGISDDIMYAIVRDGGSTYLQVYDNNDRLLAEQKINKKYCNMVIDAENGGCWISKKNNKDPLLFIWADGQLLIYEED